MRLSLYEFATGVETAAGARVVYDVENDLAHFGAATVAGRALVWELGPAADVSRALLSAEVPIEPAGGWIMRCDRVDFPPGAIAYTHTHPGPGIRFLLRGELEVRTEGGSSVHGPGSAWFERGPEPVYAAASARHETSFVRVLLLPDTWAGRRTIRYVDPADERRPKRQRATVYLEHRIAEPA